MTPTTHFRGTKPVDLLKGSEPDAIAKPWIHILPKGEHPGDIDIPAGYEVKGYGKVEEDTTVQGTTVLDGAVLRRIMAEFSGEMLVDYEHHSHDKDKRTDAAGWGVELRNAADGLELQVDWAAPARQQILDKVYRFISPELSGRVECADGDFRFYPSALTGAGLTNRPKLRALRPVSANRENQTKTTTMDYKSELCKILKLDPATAKDEDIQSKLAGQPADDATSKNREQRITDLEAENKQLKDAAITADLERFSDVIDDKEGARELLSMNREKTVKVFESLQAKLGKGGGNPPAVYQKNRTTPPDGRRIMTGLAEEEDAATAKFRAVEAKAHELVRERKLPWTQAFEEAKAALQ